MRGLINIFVRRYVTTTMIITAIIIAAVFSVLNMPINRLPEIFVPRVTVETLYPGMAADEIRSMVTIPLEDGLSAIKGLERIRSITRDNRSFISLDFRWGTDPMAASVLVREAVDTVYPGLPEGIRKPTVTSDNSSGSPHAVIAVSSRNGNAEFARRLAEYEIQAHLRRIDGVGSVVIIGGEIAEEKLELDVPRLAALGLSPSDFAGMIIQETIDMPAGNAREGNMELVVISSGRPESLYAFSQLILPAAGGTLRIEDAGELYSSTARRESIFVYNGKEATALEIYRRPGADPVRLSRDIRKMLEETSSAFSRDAQIELVADSTPSLINSITGLVISASLSTIAVVIVLLLFLRRLKHSLLASISIPFSIAVGICMLSVTGKSLNSMSLSGLAMGISLVSDISVIVLDLLHRSFGNRESVPDPEEIGNKAFSIAGSSIASTLTTALVFIPIITLPGALGSLFGDIAVALVASVTAGWFYAQFCLPSLYRLFFSSAGFKSSKNIKSVFAEGSSSYLQNSVSFKNGFIKKYSELLSSLLRRPEKIFLVASILICIGFFTLFMRPITFINPDDTEEVWVSVVFPPGTLMNSLENYAIDISHYISELPSVKTVYGGAGSEEEDVNRRANIDYRREELILRCVLEKNVKPEIALVEITDIMNRFDRENNLAPFSVYFPKDRIETLLGLSSAHTFVIKANNRNELLDRIETAKNAFNAQSIAANFRPSGKRPELRLYPNREVAAHLSMSAAQIAETLYIINEGVVAAKLEIDGRPLDVRVTGQNTNSGFLTQNSIQRLEQIPLRTSQGRTVFLGSLGRIEQKEAEASLARLDRSDVIYADITAENFNSKTIKQITAQFPWFSQADESAFSRYRNSLFLYVFLVLILLYITMGAQFESFLLPLILMITIPFSLAGAGAALLIVGSKIDSGAILGLAVLFGLVVNNSLILYEISEQKIRSGLFPAAAVYRGACERFQAILITMITTIIALLPLIISPMGNSQKSMAAAMLGGLAVSTLLSLFAIPPILIRFFRWKLSRGGYK